MSAAAKAHTLGTHRAVEPARTLEAIRPLLAEAGVTRLADATGLDSVGIPVIFAIRPNSRALAIEGGKGLDRVSATVSAAMEALERATADSARPETFVATHAELADAEAAPPVADLPLQRESLFDPHHRDEWVWAEDLAAGGPLAMPADMIGLQPPRRGPRWLHYQTGTNGLASGNNAAEATAAALYEVIERDSVACWTDAVAAGATRWRGVDGDAISHPEVRSLLERFERAGLEILLADATGDTGVATYVAWACERHRRQVGVCRGYGSHLDPAVAMARALTEVAQARLSLIAGARDDRFTSEWRNARRSDSPGRLARLRAQVPATVAHPRPDDSTDSFEGDIAILLRRLAGVGLARVAVLDLTPPGWPVSVVRVWVPGLEGYVTSYRRPGYRALGFVAAAAPEEAETS